MSMGITTLHGLDSVTASGILARAALSLSDFMNPAAKYLLPDEENMRKKVLDEVRAHLGIRVDSEAPSDLERIVDFLDSEADSLDEPIDEKKALERLSERGELPTDLYDVIISNEVQDVYEFRQFDVELIINTVRNPDKTQHFRPTGDTVDVPLISMFAKHFRHKYLNQSFTLLVIGVRSGLQVFVGQVWRIYADSSAGRAGDLVDFLKQFIEDFGLYIRIDGKKTKFVSEVTSDKPFRTIFDIDFTDDNAKAYRNKSKQHKFQTAHYARMDKNGFENSRLIYAVDLIKYKSKIEAHNWRNEKAGDILNVSATTFH